MAPLTMLLFNHTPLHFKFYNHKASANISVWPKHIFIKLWFKTLIISILKPLLHIYSGIQRSHGKMVPAVTFAEEEVDASCFKYIYPNQGEKCEMIAEIHIPANGMSGMWMQPLIRSFETLIWFQCVLLLVAIQLPGGVSECTLFNLCLLK